MFRWLSKLRANSRSCPSELTCNRARDLRRRIRELEHELGAARKLNRYYVQQRDDYRYAYEALEQGLIARAVPEEEESNGEA